MAWGISAFGMALVLALTGCGGKGKAADSPSNTTTTEETPPSGHAGQGGDQPAATGSDAGASGDTCVKDCEQRNMARAVSADIIRKDCEAECAQDPVE